MWKLHPGLIITGFVDLQRNDDDYYDDDDYDDGDYDDGDYDDGDNDDGDLMMIL